MTENIPTAATLWIAIALGLFNQAFMLCIINSWDLKIIETINACVHKFYLQKQDLRIIETRNTCVYKL